LFVLHRAESCPLFLCGVSNAYRLSANVAISSFIA
jgi:hypothetical protein